MLSEKFTPRASTSERSKRLRASSLSKCRRTSPLSRTSLSGLGPLSSSSEGEGDEVRMVAVCGFDKYSSSLMQSVSHLVRRRVVNKVWSFIYLWRLILVPVEHKSMLEKDSTWYRTHQIKQARVLFALGHWFTNLEGTARFASYQDCFSMASKSSALGVVPLFSFRDQKPVSERKKHLLAISLPQSTHRDSETGGHLIPGFCQ